MHVDDVGSALRYPETKVASCSMSCRLPQIDLIAQGADASRELMCDGFAVALASAEIGGPQVGMLGAVTQHVIDRGEDGGRHGNDRLLVADARLEAPILGTVVAGALARRCPGTLHQHRLEPGAALLDAPRTLLAGALVEPRHDAGPAQEMAGTGEDAHVRTDLGDDGRRRHLLDAGYAGQAFDGGAKGRDLRLDALIELDDPGLDLIE